MPPGDTARLYHRLTSYAPDREWDAPQDDARIVQGFTPNELATFPAHCKAYPDGLPVTTLPRSWDAGGASATAVLAGPACRAARLARPRAPGAPAAPVRRRRAHLRAQRRPALPLPRRGLGGRPVPVRGVRRGARRRRAPGRRALVRPAAPRAGAGRAGAGRRGDDARADRRPLAHGLALRRARVPPPLLGRRLDPGAHHGARRRRRARAAPAHGLPGRRGHAARRRRRRARVPARHPHASATASRRSVRRGPPRPARSTCGRRASSRW